MRYNNISGSLFQKAHSTSCFKVMERFGGCLGTVAFPLLYCLSTVLIFLTVAGGKGRSVDSLLCSPAVAFQLPFTDFGQENVHPSEGLVVRNAVIYMQKKRNLAYLSVLNKLHNNEQI